MGKIKCPKCGSYNVSYTMLGCIERTGTYGVAIAGSLIVSSLTPSWMHTQTSSMIKKLFHQSIVVIDVIINFIPKKKVKFYVVYC